MAENRLAGETSTYLRGAAGQPVHWYPWGEDAFRRAKELDRPILLDIGATWCHWCHVIDRESYEDPELAKIINDHFVAIKVDRDERPDIDARYQTAVSALTGQGGWPLTAFLTPEGKPFYGGTYFPPDDNLGRPGMKRVLESIAHNYRDNKTEIFSSAERISEALSGIEKFEGPGAAANRPVVEGMIENIGRMFDSRFGGFGSAPKFPHPSAIELLLDQHLETRQAWLLSIVTTTLERMG
ncbi:MAG: DUF255 domain-containing protein, partial [Thermoplasmata archaeon]|nr:DUF255 domain-containing protein [Thermoplasmata archaeon]